MQKLNDLLIKAAYISLKKQNSDGSMPPGHNGPYCHPETPVRNTAHWLFTFSSIYEKTGDIIWKTACDKAVSYLMSKKSRPNGTTFHCRNQPNRDACNGLIGQAWVIEALVKAAEVLNNTDCMNLAEETFLLHPFNKRIGIWKRVEVDGNVLSYDGTFNHQLWFSAAGSLLTNNSIAQERAKLFLHKIAQTFITYPDNIIFHSSPMGSLLSYFPETYHFIQQAIRILKIPKRKKTLYLKSVGYHAFNLYAFAILKKQLPNEALWNSKDIEAILAAYQLPNFIKELEHSQYGFHYNLSGIEQAFAVETFWDNQSEAERLINLQFKKTYYNEENLFSLSAADRATANARIYEATRFRYDYHVNQSNLTIHPDSAKRQASI